MTWGKKERFRVAPDACIAGFVDRNETGAGGDLPPQPRKACQRYCPPCRRRRFESKKNQGLWILKGKEQIKERNSPAERYPFGKKRDCITRLRNPSRGAIQTTSARRFETVAMRTGGKIGRKDRAKTINEVNSMHETEKVNQILEPHYAHTVKD